MENAWKVHGKLNETHFIASNENTTILNPTRIKVRVLFYVQYDISTSIQQSDYEINIVEIFCFFLMFIHSYKISVSFGLIRHISPFVCHVVPAVSLNLSSKMALTPRLAKLYNV